MIALFRGGIITKKKKNNNKEPPFLEIHRTLFERRIEVKNVEWPFSFAQTERLKGHPCAADGSRART